jgi:predicted acyl esterase
MTDGGATPAFESACLDRRGHRRLADPKDPAAQVIRRRDRLGIPGDSLTPKLPNADHIVLPGHRIMVQIQSSWFPLYDRNPQTFVPNIFFAKPTDYVAATQRVFHAPDEASFIDLPVAP